MYKLLKTAGITLVAGMAFAFALFATPKVDINNHTPVIEIVAIAQAQTFSPDQILTCNANGARKITISPPQWIDYTFNIPQGMTNVSGAYWSDQDPTKREWSRVSGPTHSSQAGRLYFLEVNGLLNGVFQQCVMEIQFYTAAVTNGGTSASSSTPTTRVAAGASQVVTLANRVVGTTNVKEKQFYTPSLFEANVATLLNVAGIDGLKIHGLSTATAESAAVILRTIFGGNAGLQTSINNAGAAVRNYAANNGGFTNYGASNARYRILSDGSAVLYLGCSPNTTVCNLVLQFTLADPNEANAVRLVVIYTEALQVSSSADPAIAKMETDQTRTQIASGNMQHLVSVFMPPVMARLEGLRLKTNEKGETVAVLDD